MLNLDKIPKVNSMTKIEVEKITSLTGHKDCIYTIEKGESDRVIYSAGGDGMVVKWDLDQPDLGKLVAKVENSVYALRFHEGKLLVGHNFTGLHLINPLLKKEEGSTSVSASPIFDVKATSTHIYMACGDGMLVVLDAKDLSTIAKIKVSAKSLRTIAINEADNLLVTGDSDFTISVFNLQTMELTDRQIAHENSVFTLAFSPDGIYLLSGGRDARLKVWAIRQKKLEHVETIVAHLFAINNIAFREDGKYFATCSMDKSVKVWETGTFSLKKVIDKARHAGHGTSVNKVLWSSSDTIVSCSDDRSISVWKVKNL